MQTLFKHSDIPSHVRRRPVCVGAVCVYTTAASSSARKKKKCLSAQTQILSLFAFFFFLHSNSASVWVIILYYIFFLSDSRFSPLSSSASTPYFRFDDDVLTKFDGGI